MKFIIGADEAGRGCIAGSIFAAASTIVETDLVFFDSKKLSKENRKTILKNIMSEVSKNNILYEVAYRDSNFIDKHGLGQANKDIFIECIDRLIFKLYSIYGQDIDIEVIIDGNLKLSTRMWKDIEFKSVIKADDKFQAVSLASIFAKTTKDGEMINFSKKHPNYSFEKHSGYDTKLHREALEEYGYIKNIHRESTKTIQKYKGNK